jgi:nucleotide-binding universal stress UspA family protein
METIATQTRIQLKNILYCTDFSDAATNALPFAAGFARHFGSKLIGSFVRLLDQNRWEVPAPDESTEGYPWVRIHNQFDQFPGIQNEVLIGEGDLWRSVKAVIKEKEVDLVVVGTRGRTGFKKLLLGSAAENIFRRAPCAVLTVGPHAPRQPSHEGEISEILYAADFRPESMVAAAYAISLAQEYQAHLTLLHVIAEHKTGDLVTPEQIQKATEQRLHELVRPESELWCEPHCIVGQGAAADEILTLAEQRNTDLIVLGVRRPSGAAETHLPIATAHKVVSHATCPVLTVRG